MMARPKLSGIDKALTEDADRIAGYLFVLLFLVGAMAAMVIAGTQRQYLWYDVIPLLALPFAVIGVISYLYRRRWLAFVVVAAVCIVAFVLSREAGYILLFVLVCTRGAAVMAAVAQRRMFPVAAKAVTRSGSRPKKGFGDHLVRFVFGIQPNTDTRVSDMESSVRRRGIPFDELVDTLRLALVPMLIIWTALFAIFTFHFTFSKAYVAVFTVSLYVVAIAVPPIVMRTLDVRFGTEGEGSRLYDGLLGTAARMSVPLVLMLIIVALALYTNAATVGYIAASAVFVVVCSVATLIAYYLDFESGAVRSIVEGRAGYIPEKEVRRGTGRGLEGVPGTPMRKTESCFSDQRY